MNIFATTRANYSYIKYRKSYKCCTKSKKNKWIAGSKKTYIPLALINTLEGVSVLNIGYSGVLFSLKIIKTNCGVLKSFLSYLFYTW